MTDLEPQHNGTPRQGHAALRGKTYTNTLPRTTQMFFDLKRLLKSGLHFASSCDNANADRYASNPKLHLSDAALGAARNLRGNDREPAVIIHGVMQRSGTVFIGELLRLHPHIHAYPNDLWEIPFLGLTGDMLRIQEQFFQRYKQNIGKIAEHDFLPLFGASLIGYLHSLVPQGKRMLLKVPDVSFLSYFPAVFPFEHLLLLLRDGRDVVSSTIRTWPNANFSAVCQRWDHSARLMMEFHRHRQTSGEPCHLARYEEVVEKPEQFVQDACNHFGLDVSSYPFDQISKIPARGSSALQQTGKVTWNPITRPPDFKPVGRWKTWSIRQKKRFKAIAGQTLIDAGYSNTLDW